MEKFKHPFAVVEYCPPQGDPFSTTEINYLCSILLSSPVQGRLQVQEPVSI